LKHDLTWHATTKNPWRHRSTTWILEDDMKMARLAGLALAAVVMMSAPIPCEAQIEWDLELDPGLLHTRLAPGETDLQPLEVLNFGEEDAPFYLYALERAAWVPGLPMDPIDLPDLSVEQAAARTSEFVPARPRGPLVAYDTLEVLATWVHGLTFGWGLGVQQPLDMVWVGDLAAAGGEDLDHQFTREGVATGKMIDTSDWAGVFAADMAFDVTTGMLWQLDVGGGDCIHELDPARARATGDTICWDSPTSERGLAYDPVSDTFFVGGWNTLSVTRFDRDGTVLQTANVGLEISGLAYNPVTEHLYAIENSETDMITVFDVADGYAVVGSYTVEGFGDYAGAGLGISCDGHLWAVNQADGLVYEIDSGEGGACIGSGLPWLKLSPDSGIVPADLIDGPQGEVLVDVEFMADGISHFGLMEGTITLLDADAMGVESSRVCMTRAFDDVTEAFWADLPIHATAGARITVGCGLGEFCPNDEMQRHVMANWLVKLMHGPTFSPQPCTDLFGDVVCELTPNSDYVEQLYADGITGGCSADPLLYCPYDAVTRAQMAVFLLRATEGPDYEPPPCEGLFEDVSCPDYWAVDWIEELYARGITVGCSADPLLYCPSAQTSRAEMAAFIQRAWELPMCEIPD
jgi:hypothetical protein